MIGNFSSCLTFTMRPENDGSPYHLDPKDPGGATKWGVTFTTFKAWRESNGCGIPTVSDLANMKESERDAIYATDYWGRLDCNRLPAGLDLMAFDFGVNAGNGISARALQRAAGLYGDDIDGWVGDQTISYVLSKSPFGLISSLADMQTAWYQTLKDFPEFGHGWLRRTDDRRRASVSMLAPASQCSATMEVTLF